MTAAEPADGRRWRGCVFIGVSLDGYIAAADGTIGWLTDPAPRAHTASETDARALVWETFYPTIDTLVMGRRTYDTVLGFGDWPFDGKSVIVLSSTLITDDPRILVVASIDEARRRLEEDGARRVYIDGGVTIQGFLSAGLVDELTVSIAPVLLGGGSRLFGALDRDILLTLRGTHGTAQDGMVRITYDLHHP